MHSKILIPADSHSHKQERLHVWKIGKILKYREEKLKSIFTRDMINRLPLYT